MSWSSEARLWVREWATVATMLGFCVTQLALECWKARHTVALVALVVAAFLAFGCASTHHDYPDGMPEADVALMRASCIGGASVAIDLLV